MSNARVAGKPIPPIIDRPTAASARVRRPIDLGEWFETALAGVPVGFPGPRRNCLLGYVYVVEFSFGVIKVGQTIAPRGRLRQHVLDAVRFNGEVTRWWLSAEHIGWRENESALITWCDDNGRQTFGEYFADVSFDQVLRFVNTLQFGRGNR